MENNRADVIFVLFQSESFYGCRRAFTVLGSMMLYKVSSVLLDVNEWMNEHFCMMCENFHSKPCTFTVPCRYTHVGSDRLKLPKTFHARATAHNDPHCSHKLKLPKTFILELLLSMTITMCVCVYVCLRDEWRAPTCAQKTPVTWVCTCRTAGCWVCPPGTPSTSCWCGVRSSPHGSAMRWPPSTVSLATLSHMPGGTSWSLAWWVPW